LLAVEIAVKMRLAAKTAGTFDYTGIIGLILLAIALVFVYRSFYGMRIVDESGKHSNSSENADTEKEPAVKHAEIEAAAVK